MTNDDVLDQFRAAGALREGHFVLDVPAYPADALPPELTAIPAEDPGSRRSSQ